MFLSLYPTDSEETREGVVDAARALGAEVFTSLHIPESDDLASYGTYLADLHRREGLNFCADISPTTLQKLSIGLDDLTLLHEWGVGIVRIDFGFTTDQVRRIADDGGFRIAINASTLTQAELDALDGIDLVAWHNYYPRPETGLSTGFFTSQNRLLADRGCAIYSFFPGEVSFRAPLGLGLPTLEHQRHRNAYVNHLELATLAPGTAAGCAEGTLLPHHLEWIGRYERTGEITVPVAGLDPEVSFLLDGVRALRIEGTGISHRIEGTRQPRNATRILNADSREAGSLQMDTERTGRYCGEIHLMTTDRPLTAEQVRVGQIATPYRGLVDLLRPGAAVRFVRA